MNSLRSHVLLASTLFILFFGACSVQTSSGTPPSRVTSQGAGNKDSGPADTSQSGDSTKAEVPTAPVGGPLQLALTLPSQAMQRGDVSDIKAQILGADGATVDVSGEAIWTIEPREAGIFTKSGHLNILRSGKIKVTAACRGLVSVMDIDVAEPNEPKNPRVALNIAEQETKVVVPAGLTVDIYWNGTDIDSCVLYIGENEVARDNLGVLSQKFFADTRVRAICKYDHDSTVEDMVSVHVTLPKVQLNVSGGTENITVQSGTEVPLAWSSSDASMCEIKSGDSVLATEQNGSTSYHAISKQTVMALCRDRAGNSDSKSIDIYVTHQTKFSIASGSVDQIPGTATTRPVSIIFALDITGSMNAQIATVKDNVNNFVTELAKKNFSPKIAVIPFRDKVPKPGNLGDVPEGRLELTDNPTAVRAFVSTLKSSGGGDAWEASLGAVEEAMAMLRNNETRADAMKIIILVTDQPGHHGARTTDCDITPTVNLFSTLTDAEQNLFKVFYSTPTTGAPCSGFLTATTQMTALLGSILKAEPQVDKRGGSVPWPFAAANLVTDVTNLLVKVTPPINLSCVTQSAKVSLTGKPLFEWAAGDLSIIEAQRSSNKPLTIDHLLTDAEHTDFIAGLGNIETTECCVSQVAAAAGNFGSCLKTKYYAAVPFSID